MAALGSAGILRRLTSSGGPRTYYGLSGLTAAVGPGLLGRGWETLVQRVGLSIFVFCQLAFVVSPGRAQSTTQATASQPATQVSTRVAPSHQERLNDYIGTIEGQNTAEVRRFAARELLLQGWVETPPRIASILAGPNAAAKVAVATALADLPDRLERAYVEPLIGMLADADVAVREAGANALATYPPDQIISRLKVIVLNPSQPRPARSPIRPSPRQPWRRSRAPRRSISMTTPRRRGAGGRRTARCPARPGNSSRSAASSAKTVRTVAGWSCSRHA